jgi:hypothetical protein
MTPEVLSSYPEIQKLHVAEVLRYLSLAIANVGLIGEKFR